MTMTAPKWSTWNGPVARVYGVIWVFWGITVTIITAVGMYLNAASVTGLYASLGLSKLLMQFRSFSNIWEFIVEAAEETKFYFTDGLVLSAGPFYLCTGIAGICSGRSSVASAALFLALSLCSSFAFASTGLLCAINGARLDYWILDTITTSMKQELLRAMDFQARLAIDVLLMIIHAASILTGALSAAVVLCTRNPRHTSVVQAEPVAGPQQPMGVYHGDRPAADTKWPCQRRPPRLRRVEVESSATDEHAQPHPNYQHVYPNLY